MHPPALNRLRLSIQGLLQGIGFRPFVYNLAHEIGLAGWVQNSPQGVSIEVEGTPEKIKEFLRRLSTESPPNTILHKQESVYLQPSGFENFQIRNSKNSGEQTTTISPDIATCPDCLKEIFDPSNRRYLYPFTNCSHCGPRFSIIESLPYDRQRTSMQNFAMCDTCLNEYNNPQDRRFHAQPNACPNCGPHLELWGTTCLSKNEEALDQTVKTLKEGSIVAIKGLGGFHLMVNACDDQAVLRLRRRKHREEKPFALMFPDLRSIKNTCDLSSLEEQALLSPEAPIVLLRRKLGTEAIEISSKVAPSSPYFGAMLPSNPLHHILMDRLGSPVVATSANISDETICTQEEEAFIRLHDIADFFLIHNRPIVRHVDDSIVREISGSVQILRRARGYAPLPITLEEKPMPCIAVGGHLKNTVAVTQGNNIFMSQHIGDLGNVQATIAFEGTIQSLKKLYNIQSSPVACDFHPDYSSTQWAEKNHKDTIPVQHHVAHVFSCMAEHDIEGPLLGIAWDGTGYGLDGTVWGGEFFHLKSESIHRVACWQPFPLPGTVINEPRRSALGLLYAVLGKAVFDRPKLLKNFSGTELPILKSMLENKINCTMTSSCGRLFDAVASIAGVRQINSYEGQTAIELENSVQEPFSEDHYPIDLIEDGLALSDFKRSEHVPDYYDLNLKYQLRTTAMILELLNDISDKTDIGIIAVKFHNTLVESIVSVAKRIGEERVLLSGGCFQNKFLSERAIHRLHQEGFKPYWHQRIPPNDGGIALGQIFAASWFAKRKEGSDVLSHTR